MAKQFGLFIPGKQKQIPIPRKTIFDEDQALEEDEEDTFQPMVPKPSMITSKIRKETKMVIDKALEEDPNVFDYDGVYDNLKQAETSMKKDFKPKYMPNLLKNAELRKRDQERREEKKIQKEREEEGDEFKDKEAFVTSAYKEKLEELRQTEEREKREKELEEMFDVKKQVDMSGFHRHLLNQQIGEEAVPDICRDKFDPPEAVFKSRRVKNQSLRNRREEDEEQDESETFPAENLENPDEKCESGNNETDKEENLHGIEKSKPCPEATDQILKIAEILTAKPETVIEEAPVVPVKEPVDRKKLIEELFTKRTVDDKFDEAVRRYQERKASRNDR